jgi:hypothetical protein
MASTVLTVPPGFKTQESGIAKSVAVKFVIDVEY